MQPGILFIVLVAVIQIHYGARPTHAAVSGYLDFDNLPETNFSCEGKVIGGYYADVETACQMFHVCTIGQKGEVTDIKFLCLNGTVFDQETRVCERVDEVDCSQAEEFYGLNLELYGANAFIAGRTVPEDLEDAANSGEIETSTPSSTTPSTTTTTTVATTTTTKAPTTTAPPLPPQISSPSPSKPSHPKFVPPTPRPHAHHQQQFGPTSPGTLSLLAFANNQNHEGLRNVVPHQHQQIFHNSQRPSVRPSLPTRAPLFPTTRRPPLSFSLKPHLTSNRPPLQPQQQHVVHSSHFPATARPSQILQSQAHRHHQPSNPTLHSFKQFQQEQKAQQELQRQKEQQQQQEQQQHSQEQFSPQHHYFDGGYHHNHNFQHHTQLPQSSPSSLLSASPSPPPSHLLSPPPPPPTPSPSPPSPSQTPYHHTQQFHPLLLNGLALDQGQGQQQPSPSPNSPTPNSPHHQSPFFGGHHFSTPVPSLREGKTLEHEDEEAAAHEQHQQQIQQQQIQQQQQQHQQHQQHIQQHQQKVQKQQQKQQEQQQQQIHRQQQQQEHHIHQQQQQQQQHHVHHHFPPPPTVAVVSSSSSTSTSHSSVAIVTGRFNNPGTSTTTTPTPPPVTSTSISISGPSAGGQTITDHRIPQDPSAPSAEDGTEAYDDEYSDSDYALDSFFEDVPKLSSVGSLSDRSRRRKRRESDEGSLPASTPTREELAARRRGRGRQRQNVITLQVSPQPVIFAQEDQAKVRNVVNGEQLRTQSSPVITAGNESQRSRSRQRSNFAQVRASFRARPIAIVEDDVVMPKAPQGNLRKIPRRRPSFEKDLSAVREDNTSLPLGTITTTTPIPTTTTEFPETSFSCVGKVPGGLYADPEADCVLFHICSQGRHRRLIDNKFLCGPGTSFNQQSRTCQVKELVDCPSAPSYYFLNTHFQHHVIGEVRPELQFEAQKIRVKRSSPLSSAENSEQRKQTIRKRDTIFSPPNQENLIIFQHCFDEKHCGNKWKIHPNLDYYKELRKKRDLSNPILDRKRPRFGLSPRTTTHKPKESKPHFSRFSHQSSKTPLIRQENSRPATEDQGKTKSTQRGFVPSQSRYQRTGRVEQATEGIGRRAVSATTTSRPKFGRGRPISPTRQSNLPTTTSKPKFGRGRANPTTPGTTARPKFGRGRFVSSFSSTTTARPFISRGRSSFSSTTTAPRPKFDRSKIFKPTVENRGVTVSAKNGDSKLPVTFRQHHILAQSKTLKTNLDDKIEEKLAVTEAVATSNDPELKTDEKEKEKGNENNSQSEEEYVDEDDDESDENYVEGDDVADDKGDSKPTNNDSKSKSPSLKISEDSSDEKGIKILNIFPVTSQGTVYKAEIGGKEYRFNGKDWVKVEDDKKPLPDEDDEAYSDEYYDEEEDTMNSKNSRSESKTLEGGDLKGLMMDSKSTEGNSQSQRSNNGKLINDRIMNTGEDVYEDESYEDEWESEEIDNTDLDHERVPEKENNFVGRGLTNGDMTELSPTGTTLNVKQDNEFELNETEEDDFEETNRAVRKTSLGRRRIQTLNVDTKVRVRNDKASVSRGNLGNSQDDDNGKSTHRKGKITKNLPEDDVYEESEGMDEEDFYEEEGQDGLSSLSSQKGLGKSNDRSQMSYDDYVDEYEEGQGKVGALKNMKVNLRNTFNRGSLLHLPIPTWKNVRSGSQSIATVGKKSWGDDEENYTLEQDDEYTNESNEGFQDEDEQYDDQEDGHDHTAGGKEAEEELYSDEEEVIDRRGRAKYRYDKFQGTTSVKSEDQEYYDNEDESGKRDNSKASNIRQDDYDVVDDAEEKVLIGKSVARQGVRQRSNQNREMESTVTPLPYLRLVNPDSQDEYTTPLPPTPNLFRTLKPRQKSWKQASAPEPPPVILPRRTTVAPIEENTQPPRGYRRGKMGYLGRRGTAKEEEQPVTQPPRQWQPRQQVTQVNPVLDTKGFRPSRGRFNNRASEVQNQARTNKATSPKVPRFYLPKPTIPAPSTEATSPPMTPYRTNKPQVRTYVRKKIADIVQFSESQVSKSRENYPVPYPQSEKDSEYFPSIDAEKNTFDNRKSKTFNEFPHGERVELISQTTLPPVEDKPPPFSPSSLASNSTYLPLPVTTSTEATPEAFSCSGLEMYMYHADPSNPRLFHYCSHGFSRGQILDFRFSCIKGMYFSEEIQNCV